MNDNNNEKLQCKWGFWYHSIDTKSWNKSSYTLLMNVNNIYDLKILIDYIKKENFHNSMFFLMKDGIFPNWEDTNNINGSCISLKIPKNHIQDTWNQLIIQLCTHTIFIDDYKSNVLNGISITPKKEFNIVKFWFKDNIKNLKSIIDTKPYITNKNYVYKKNR